MITLLFDSNSPPGGDLNPFIQIIDSIINKKKKKNDKLNQKNKIKNFTNYYSNNVLIKNLNYFLTFIVLYS